MRLLQLLDLPRACGSQRVTHFNDLSMFGKTGSQGASMVGKCRAQTPPALHPRNFKNIYLLKTIGLAAGIIEGLRHFGMVAPISRSRLYYRPRYRARLKSHGSSDSR